MNYIIYLFLVDEKIVLFSTNMCRTKGAKKVALRYMTTVLVTSHSLTFLVAGPFSKLLQGVGIF